MGAQVLQKEGEKGLNGGASESGSDANEETQKQRKRRKDLTLAHVTREFDQFVSCLILFICAFKQDTIRRTFAAERSRRSDLEKTGERFCSALRKGLHRPQAS